MAVIHLRKGDDLNVIASFTSNDAPFDMTGWIVMAQMSYGNCVPVDLEVAWTSEATGEASVTLDSADTAQLHADDYLLQMRAIAPGGSSISTLPYTVRVRD